MSFLEFIDKYDRHSVFSYYQLTIREWIKRDCLDDQYNPIFQQKLDALVESVLQYREINSTATGHNDDGLVGQSLSTLGGSPEHWWLINNGMDNLPKTLGVHPLVKDILKKGRRVLGLAKEGGKVKVSYSEYHSSEVKNEIFDLVLVTAPFGSVRLFDMSGMEFSQEKTQAIRILQYDHSTKILVQFGGRFWEEHNKLQGGASRTDLPIRTVIYPSIGVNLPVQTPSVLLASYTWGNDAIIWGHTDNYTLREVVLRNLEILHGLPLNYFNRNEFEVGKNIWIHTWLEAFGKFGPNQYRLMISGMVPEYGVHFAGEHLSTTHGWIQGAIHSACRAMREILVLYKGYDRLEVFKDEDLTDTEFTEESWLAYMEYVCPTNLQSE